MPEGTEQQEVKLEAYDVLQVQKGGEWMDFATIRDADDMRYARLAVAGKHPQFSGTYRVTRKGTPILVP